MGYITDTATWEANIYEIATTDKVKGGTGEVANIQAEKLANRTKYLKQHVDAVELNPTKYREVIVITATTVLTATHFGALLVVIAGADIVLTLPDAATNIDALKLVIVNKSNYNVTINRAGTDVINIADTTLVLVGLNAFCQLVLQVSDTRYLSVMSSQAQTVFTAIVPDATGDFTVPATVLGEANTFKMRLNKNNEVEFRGFVEKGVAAGIGTILIYVLPVDKRPVQTLSIPCGTDAYGVVYNVVVHTDGRVICQVADGTILSLDAVRFSVDA